jgi:hypothetical protein
MVIDEANTITPTLCWYKLERRKNLSWEVETYSGGMRACAPSKLKKQC